MKQKARDKRLPKEQRRQQIIDSALPLFASQGFKGVTTKALAKHSSVSEALLYQYFSSKEELYIAVQDSFRRTSAKMHQLIQHEKPSAKLLVQLLVIIGHTVTDRQTVLPGGELYLRMIVHSLLEDGAFAKAFAKEHLRPMISIMEECLEVAEAQGYLRHSQTKKKATAWLVHHLFFGLSLFNLPETHVADYGLAMQDVIKETIVFVLRGLGFHEHKIEELMVQHREPFLIPQLYTNPSKDMPHAYE